MTDMPHERLSGRPPRFFDHPGRTAAQGETHARPIEPVDAPARIRRVAFMLGQDPTSGQRAFERFARWCRDTGVDAPREGERRWAFRQGERRVIWELHTEFATFTWITSSQDHEAWPTEIGLDAFADEPIIVAVRVELEDSPEISEAALAAFDPVRLCYAKVERGTGEIATDLIVDPDGYTRYDFAAGALRSVRRGLLVRRLLEIETYRVLALLGLPLARTLSPDIGELEVRLAHLMARVGAAKTTLDNQNALDELHALSVRVAQVGEQTRFRFAATKAYGDVLAQRLGRLGETAISDHSTMKRYLAHRIDPALATCLAVEKRQTALADTLAQTTELLNTRIGVDLERQNQVLLNAISDTAQSQYRLQTTVEGLSAIAISYYSLGILGYILHGFEDYFHFDKSLVVALLAPVILVGVWASVRRIRKHHVDALPAERETDHRQP